MKYTCLNPIAACGLDLFTDEYEKTETNIVNTEVEEKEEVDDGEKKDIDDSFYTRSMDLSEYDFEEIIEGKTSVKKVLLIALVVIILLAIIGVVTFFVLQHFGIELNISKLFK